MAQSLMSSDQVAGPAPTDYRRRGFTWCAALLALVLIPIWLPAWLRIMIDLGYIIGN